MRRQRRFARREIACIVILSAAVLIGGGGVDEAIPNMIVELAAIAALALCAEDLARAVRTAPRGLLALCIATIALPIVQIVPLPPGTWTALPGRELVQEAFSLVGAAHAWQPISVFPQRTLLTALSLIPAATVMALTLSLREDRRWIAIATLAGLGLVNVGIGAMQLASGGKIGAIYPGGAADQLFGTFANHNSAGIFLVCALCVLPAAAASFRALTMNGPIYLFLALVLFVGAILTQSRSTILILLIPIFLHVWLFWRTRTESSAAPARRSSRSKYVLAILALFLVTAGILGSSSKVQNALSQFDDLQDARLGIWEDGHLAAQRFWPVGSGAGTFDEVFQLDESLEHVGPGRAARAHNDYLELAVESGAPGLILLAAWAGYIAFIARAGFRPGSRIRICALAAISCVAAQSLLDYPLRNLGMLCFIACLLGLLHGRETPEKRAEAGATP